MTSGVTEEFAPSALPCPASRPLAAGVQLLTKVCAVFLLPICAASCLPRHAADPLPHFPRLVLWAWERPENLTFIVPKSTGVAYLAGTLTTADHKLQCRPRMQPLFIPATTPVIAVVRIDARDHDLPPFSEVSDQIVQLTRGTRASAVQIDFDAPPWARGFYRNLMGNLRQRLPESIALEMTALVSWCEGDDWIRGMPVVDAVPMFFRMGVDPHSPEEKMHEPLCQSSVGVSTDEFYLKIPSGRRVFVFGHQLWTEASYRAILQASKKWFSN